MTQFARAAQSCGTGGNVTVRSKRELVILVVHLLVAFAKLLRPGTGDRQSGDRY